MYKQLFGVKTGVSDHSINPCLVPAISVLEGSSFIEKHITLTKKDGGLDDPIALIPLEFAKMVSMVRSMEKLQFEDQLLFLEDAFGKARVESVIGDGVKRLADSERANYGRTNRSVHALEGLNKGVVLTEENTALLRTEKILKPGIRPEYYRDILGKRLVKDVASGQGIRTVDLGIEETIMDFPLK